MPTDQSIVVRLVVAMILAGAIGWERESAGKSAGLRTHMFVGIGATLFVVLGEIMMVRFGDIGHSVFDQAKRIEAVATAISFLGAGTIFVSRGRERVLGLTTAASIWLTAAIGVAVALERFCSQRRQRSSLSSSSTSSCH